MGPVVGDNAASVGVMDAGAKNAGAEDEAAEDGAAEDEAAEDEAAEDEAAEDEAAEDEAAEDEAAEDEAAGARAEDPGVIVGGAVALSSCVYFNTLERSCRNSESRSVSLIKMGAADATRWCIWDDVPENIRSRNHSLVPWPASPHVRGSTTSRRRLSIAKDDTPSNVSNPFMSRSCSFPFSKYQRRFLFLFGIMSQ